MSEHEMQQEMERLRRELADVRRDRDHLHKMVCDLLPVEKLEITPEEFERIKTEARDPAEVLRELFPADLHHLISDRT